LAPKSLIVAAAVVLAAGPALAREELCTHRIDEVSAAVEEALDPPGYNSAQTVLRDLRNAALRLETQMLDAACVETVEAMEAALAAYRAAGPAESAEIVPSPELGDIEARTVALADAGMDSATIRDADVYNYDNDYLGEVTGLVVSGARPTHVLIGERGFWDAGADRAAVPASMLRWDPEWKAFFAPITTGALQDAPAYMADAEWNPEANDRFYVELTD
jgi:hypothetical protein